MWRLGRSKQALNCCPLPDPHHDHPISEDCTPCHGAVLPIPVPSLLCHVCLQGGSSWPPFTTLMRHVATHPQDVRMSPHRCHVAGAACIRAGEGLSEWLEPSHACGTGCLRSPVMPASAGSALTHAAVIRN